MILSLDLVESYVEEQALIRSCTAGERLYEGLGLSCL
jgi:hypothetical protein